MSGSERGENVMKKASLSLNVALNFTLWTETLLHCDI